MRGGAPTIQSPNDRRAEFAAYRQQILDRSGHQHTLLTLNLTALSAIAGFVLSNHADARLRLLLPIVSSSIGLLWYDHARNIASLDDYIRRNLPGFSGYEEQSHGRHGRAGADADGGVRSRLESVAPTRLDPRSGRRRRLRRRRRMLAIGAQRSLVERPGSPSAKRVRSMRRITQGSTIS